MLHCKSSYCSGQKNTSETFRQNSVLRHVPKAVPSDIFFTDFLIRLLQFALFLIGSVPSPRLPRQTFRSLRYPAADPNRVRSLSAASAGDAFLHTNAAPPYAGQGLPFVRSISFGKWRDANLVRSATKRGNARSYRYFAHGHKLYSMSFPSPHPTAHGVALVYRPT